MPSHLKDLSRGKRGGGRNFSSGAMRAVNMSIVLTYVAILLLEHTSAAVQRSSLRGAFSLPPTSALKNSLLRDLRLRGDRLAFSTASSASPASPSAPTVCSMADLGTPTLTRGGADCAVVEMERPLSPPVSLDLAALMQMPVKAMAAHKLKEMVTAKELVTAGANSGMAAPVFAPDFDIDDIDAPAAVADLLAPIDTPMTKPAPPSVGGVKRGDTLNNGRYTVVRKLGSGTFGCVYCAHDQVTDEFVAIKMQKAGRKYSQVALDEVELLKTCKDARAKLHKEHAHEKSEYCAGDYIVEFTDFFEHKGSKGSQVCMHLEMLGPSLLDLIKDYQYKGVQLDVVKEIARNMLTALDFLHSSCGIIHTDVKPENILISVPQERPAPRQGLFWGSRKGRKGDADSPQWWKDHATKTPTGWSLDEGWSRDLYSDKGDFVPRAKLVDLGNACRIDKPFTPDIQTIEYRCPEVILGSGYSTPADMWSVACTVFELLTGEYLFDPKKGQGRVQYDREEDLLALQQELLGQLPVSIACGGKNSHKYFNPDGKMKHIYTLSFWGLSDVLTQKYGFDKQKADECAEFLLPMLEFDPKKRATAQQMLQHPWLQR